MMDWGKITRELQQKLDPKHVKQPTNSCKIWEKGQNGNGYGRQRYNGRSEYAHRVAWIEANGEIPKGMVIDHLCRNRLCVNVDHLELVSNAENIRRGLAGQHMKNGRAPTGNSHPRSKITENQVLAMRRDCNAGVSQREAAAKYGISQATVSQIVRRETWRHI